MPTRRQISRTTKLVKAQIAIRRGRDVSPADIAQYALYAAEKWPVRDGILSFLTTPERRAFERLEQRRKKRETTRPAKAKTSKRLTPTTERELLEATEASLTQAREQGLDAVIRLIVTQPRSIAESMPIFALHDSEKQAIRAFSERLHTEGLMTETVCQELSCSREELDRWTRDERLPYAGWRHVYYYRSAWVRVWFADVVEQAKPQLAAWRENDACGRAWRRQKTRLKSSPHQDG